jgi:hypothetical protein
VNFACEYPEDEKVLMDAFKQHNIRSNAITIPPSAAVPAGDSARFRDYGVICTLDEVSRHAYGKGHKHMSSVFRTAFTVCDCVVEAQSLL